MTPTAAEQMEVIRRIIERGHRFAQKRSDSASVDLFQHLLDELARLKKELA